MDPTEPSPAEAARRALRVARARGRNFGEGERTGGAAEEDLAAEYPAETTEEASADVRHDRAEADRTAARTVADEAEEAAPRHPTEQPPRPADAARAALRQAVAARRGAGTAAGTAAGTETGTETEPGDEGGPLYGEFTSDESPDPAQILPTPPTPPTPADPADPDAEPSASTAVRPADRAREALRAARAEARRGSTDTDTAETDAVAPVRRRRPPERPADAPAERARDVRRFLANAFRMPTEATDSAETAHPVGVVGAAGLEGTAGAEGADAPAAPAPLPSADLADPAHPRHTTDPGNPPPPPPARPPAPTTMAVPTRDGDHRRTFPRFSPRTGSPRTPDAGAPAFAETWWGNAWVDALERGALDAKRLARGRGYAEQGNVDAITVTPGLVLAYVQGSRPRPYRVQVRLRTLGDADWARFLDAAAERPGHIAALLDKEMPHSLAECGVPLLPGPGDLEPQCSCPDRGHPCKHAAALCYQTARLLDADPFVLLLLRGRGERELLDALSRLSATRAARAAQEREPAPLPGVRATQALTPRQVPPLPTPLPVPAHPEQPPVYPGVPDGPDALALDQLATDAAARAHALLTTGHDETGELTLWQDAVRLAEARPGSGLTAGSRALYASLAAAAGRTPGELARAVAAWRQGGPEGLAVLEEAWDPPAGRFDRARPLLLAADLPAFRPWRNRLTHPRGHVQLRLGRDGLWYAYESEPGDDDWWPRGTPDPDPVGALTGLGAPDDLAEN
ncbi:SWIM zinc finger family protein [Streptomyces griseosporeus]|uniref:SWIM zinc finger family protein n=1 Tax=Streptomyces griseosporeus TaxID=1910 RepID=UPI0036FEEB37